MDQGVSCTSCVYCRCITKVYWEGVLIVSGEALTAGALNSKHCEGGKQLNNRAMKVSQALK